MKSFTLGSQFYIPTHSNLITSKHKPITKHKHTTQKTKPPSKPILLNKPVLLDLQKVDIKPKSNKTKPFGSRHIVVGAASIGVMMLLMGLDDHHMALAFGPEGPLMEDFWDNMRRYGLYALTVSSGVLYAVFQPLYELLKNPISAILVLTILGGGFYIVSQVVSAMVGITEFSYEYNY
ncbi:hypothetical protein CTI12_AA441170 [Artemisia annua]|uniref:Uncharacterized protein ycf33 n=1 Tax=Artemisia annua TaxID=35608 RepID=A0A2U1LXQ6_ARTAN|nr:hypothetical protein CTI12_AA441170 [Artemisia annua]